MGYNSTLGLLNRQTGGTIELYVVAATGSDSNTGTITSPLASLDEAFRRLKYWTTISPAAPGAVIHVASGTYVLTESVGGFNLGGPVFIYGDGGGVVGQDGFTQLVAPAAAAGGSGAGVVVTSGGLTANQYRGKTIQITSGSASGDLRTIRNNTTTDIVPCSNFSAAVASTNTYRVVEPAATVEFHLYPTSSPSSSEFVSIAHDCAGQKQNALAASSLQYGPKPAVYWVNFRFKTRTGDSDAVCTPSILNSLVAFFGIELVADSGKTFILAVDEKSQLLSGFDFFTSHPMAVLPFEAGYATGRRSWTGWGLSGPSTAGGTINYRSLQSFCGYIVTAHAVILDRAMWRLHGGSLINLTGIALDLVRWSRLVTIAGSSPVPLIRSELNTAGTPALQVRSGAHAELLVGTIEKQDQGYCILVQGDASGQGAIPGECGLSTVTLTGVQASTGPTNAICVTNGGRVSYLSNPTISGFATGTQLCVRKGGPTGTVVQECDVGDIAADGDVLPALPDRISFVASGALSGFSLGVAGTFTAAAQIDGVRQINRFSYISAIRMTQVVDGSGGTTTMEVFRRRAGVNTSLGTVSLASGGGAFAAASLTPATSALRQLLVDDLIVCQFNAVQSGSPANVTLELLGGGVDMRFGSIARL